LYAAYLVRRLQSENPNVNLALIGDLNAFEFNDGIVDVTGILRGDPVADAATYLAGDSIDVFGTPGFSDLINLTTRPEFLPSERYSFLFRGDRQALDHVLVNPNLNLRFASYAIAHVNSVYPAFDPVTGQRLRDLTTRPEGYSDHDVPVARFVIVCFLPRHVTAWIGLKNSDDQGTQFDLRAEVYRNGILISSGETRCITGLTRNPNMAREVNVDLAAFDADAFTPGSTVSLKMLTRIGTNPDGSKCTGPGGSHNIAVGLRLYFDADGRASKLRADPSTPPIPDYFLDSSGTNLVLTTAAPVGANAQFSDSTSINFANGNAWKEIGTWATTVP
jgi:hypothetical protein